MPATLRNDSAAEALETADALGIECVTFGIAPGVAASG